MVTIPFVQAMVLLVMCVYWSASYWGIHEMSAGLNLLELTPFNSYYRDFWQQYFASFPSYGEDVFVVFPHQTQWWRKDVREAYMALEGRVRNGTYASDMIFSGMYEFYSRTSQETLDAMEDDPARFNRTLSRWLDRSQYQILRSDFVFDADGLQHYRFRFFARQRIPGADLVEGSRHDCKQAEQDTGGLLRCFPYADMFPYYESDISILEDTLRSLGYALIAVMIVSTFLMRHWRSWLLVMCMLVSIDVGLFGFMYHWDLQLNMITMVTLILAIGFSVDSTTHIAHTFGHAVGPTRSHRAAETLVLMGNPVFHGSFSTFLAMLIILTMDSYIFVIFFRMMTLVLVLGFAHGIILLPVLLSLVGPFDPQQQQGGAPNTTATSTPTKCTPPSHIDISITTDTEGEYRSHDVDAEHATELDERGSSTDDSQCSSSSELGEAGRPPLPPSAASAAAGRQYDDYVVSSSVRPICYDIEMELRIDRTVEVMDIRRGDVPGSS
mmetsp:Transcript_34211/g.98490  ORF Transcript_34211/g.98490 Transcript_34211/m.98490 type:complete len:496 (-) Transcript_34211:878-2365(-)